MGGYIGELLEINLTSGSFQQIQIEEDVLRKYIGGVSLGSKLMFDRMDSSVKPLDPDNPLMFLTGPFTGTPVPTSGRFAVVSKSPLTGIWGESDCGGTWGPALKRAGYDGIIVTGKSEKPVYLWINNKEVEIRSAEHLWGLDTYDLEKHLVQEINKGAQVAAIGPGGENLVLYASIMTNGEDARAIGRGGMGAVMGSKNLKAICVHGNNKVPIYDKERLMDSLRAVIPPLKEKTHTLGLYGTARAVKTTEAIGNIPIKNWQLGTWAEGAAKLTGEVMAEKILTGRFHCGSCPIGCGRTVEIKEGPFAPVKGAGPEYEAMATLGTLLLIDNLEAVVKLNEVCNRAGIDVISAGAVAAFVMEAFDKGIINSKMLGGLEVRWGDALSVIKLFNLIVNKEYLGDILSQGVKVAAKELGPRAEEFAVHVKGMEVPAHDPRALGSLAVAYATANRGACHLQAQSHVIEFRVARPSLGYPDILDRFDDSTKGELVAKTQNFSTLIDSLKMCKLVTGPLRNMDLLAEWLNYITGWNTSFDELLLVGERAYNLKRLFNNVHGISRKDDILPPRLLTHRRGEGGSPDFLPNLGRQLADYYTYREWTEDGLPTLKKLNDLGLEEEAEKSKNMGVLLN